VPLPVATAAAAAAGGRTMTRSTGAAASSPRGLSAVCTKPCLSCRACDLAELASR
jgi:hypothetical protein